MSEYDRATAPAEDAAEGAAEGADAGDVVVPWSGEPGRRWAREREGKRAPMRCILLHGFNGEPVDMCEIEHHLSAHGFAITNMLLPGHGTSEQDFAAARWEHWLDAVRAETRRSLARGERVVLIGHSMGGALSLAMAASEPGVVGVVAMCAPLSLDRSLRGFFARMHRMFPYSLCLGEDVRDWFGARRRYPRSVYRWTAMATAHSLFSALPALRQQLPSVACPTLLIYARHDHVVPFADGIEAYKLLGSREKGLVALPRSFHSVMKDVERDIVSERIVQFSARRRAGADDPQRADAASTDADLMRAANE